MSAAERADWTVAGGQLTSGAPAREGQRPSAEEAERGRHPLRGLAYPPGGAASAAMSSSHSGGLTPYLQQSESGGRSLAEGRPQWKIVRAAKIRGGFEQTSADLGVAEIGEIIEEIESRVNSRGVTRVHYARGWLSVKAADGGTILEPHAAPAMDHRSVDPRPGPPAPGAEASCVAKYSSLTMDQLRRQCEDAWLSAAGTQQELIDRLVDYEKPAGGWAAAPESGRARNDRDDSNQRGSYEPQIADRYAVDNPTHTPQLADRYGPPRGDNYSYGRDRHDTYDSRERAFSRDAAPDLGRELESAARDLAEAARDGRDDTVLRHRLEDQLQQLAQRKSELRTLSERLARSAGELARSAAQYVMKDADARNPQDMVLDRGESTRLKERALMVLAVLAENPALEDELHQPLGHSQQSAVDAWVLVVRGWAGVGGMRKDSAKAAASPWRTGSQPRTAHTDVIRHSVTGLAFAVYTASPRRRVAVCQRHPDLVGWLLDVGREDNPRHASILAHASVAFLTGTRIEVPVGAGAQRPSADAAMADSLCHALDGALRGDDYGADSHDSATPKAAHAHLIAEAIYEMSRTSANAKLLLRQDAVVRLLLEACDRYRGQNATAVVDASCRAMLYLAMDPRGAAALEMQHSHAVDILLRLSESSSVDEVTRLQADRASFALRLRKEADQRATMSYDRSGSVLVSYMTGDAKKVVALVAALRRHGTNVEVVHASELSRMTAAQMAAAIDRCSCVLLCCSRSYRESARCQLEVAYARARRTALRDVGPALIPVVLSSGFKPSASGWLTDLCVSGSTYNLAETDISTEAEQPARGAGALAALTEADVAELRAYTRANAPPALKTVLAAVAVLLGRKPEQPRDPSRGLFAEDGILDTLRALSPPPNLIHEARKYTADPQCTPDAVGKTVAGGRLLCEWVIATTSEFAALLVALRHVNQQKVAAEVARHGERQQPPLTVQIPQERQPQPQPQQQPVQQPPQPQPQPQPQHHEQRNQSAAHQQRRVEVTRSEERRPTAHLAAASTPAFPPTPSMPPMPARKPNSQMLRMDSVAVADWLRRKDLSELVDVFRSKRLDNGAALAWLSLQLNDSRPEVMINLVSTLQSELGVQIGVLYQLLFHLEAFDARG